MTRLLALVLIAAVLVGCNKKQDAKAFAPADKGGPAGPAAPPPESKNTNYQAGAGTLQNVRNAVRRGVEQAQLKTLGDTMYAMELENGRMPTKDEVLAALKKDMGYKQILSLIEDGTVILTGTKNRSALWAYEVDSETKGGLGLVAGVPNRYSADEIKQYLQGV